MPIKLKNICLLISNQLILYLKITAKIVKTLSFIQSATKAYITVLLKNYFVFLKF